MYIFFLIAVIAYYAIISIRAVRETKRMLNVPVTEKTKVDGYIKSMILNWSGVLAVLVMCLLADISFEDVGFRQISFEYNIWFSAITLIICGLFFAFLLYQIICYFVSEKYREETKEKCANSLGDSLPRSKKEKTAWFGLSLSDGICEEIVLRGFLYFLLQAIFPNISIILVVVIASALFGIWHMDQGLQGSIRTAIYGALFGCLFLVTGSLIPGILLHFFCNYSSAFLLSEE